MKITTTTTLPFYFSVIMLLGLSILGAQAQERTIEQVFYFTGNTDLQTQNPSLEVLNAITTMSQDDDKATFVALGNITDNGYPPKDKDRKKVEEQIKEKDY